MTVKRDTTNSVAGYLRQSLSFALLQRPLVSCRQVLAALTVSLLGVAASGSAPTATIVLGASASIDPGNYEAIGTSTLTLEDLNGDGLPDLVVGFQDSGPIVYINDGTATPFSQYTRDVVGPYGPSNVTVADVNGDSRPDLVVAGSLIYLNRGGKAPFYNVTGYRIGDGEGIATLDDVNGDGFPDVVTTATDDNTLALLLTHGAPITSGGYTTVTIASLTSGSVLDVKLVDVNGDGKPDLVLARSADFVGDPAGVFVYLNNGTSSPFSDGVSQQILTQLDVTRILLVDVNHDGRPDLVAAGTTKLQQMPQFLTVTLNTGAKTKPFGSPLTLTPDLHVGATCLSVSAADMNGDGLPDLLFGCVQSGNTAPTASGAIYLNNGSSDPFAGAVPIDIPGGGTTAVAAGPFVKTGPANVLIGTSPLTSFPVATQQQPVAIAETTACAASIACSINVLGGDRAVPGVALNAASLSIVAGPSHGTVTINPTTGLLTYKGVAGYSGSDTIQYQVDDSLGRASNVATVSLNVQAAPVASNDTAVISDGQSATVNVLANDTSAGAIVSGTLKIVSAPAHGTTSVANGQVIYTAGIGYSGTDSFKYVVADNLGTVSNAATVSVSVKSPATSYFNVELSADFSIHAITSPGQPAATGGLDGNGYAFSSALLGSSVSWNGMTFKLGAAIAPDAVSSTSAAAPLLVPVAKYSDLKILAAAANGAQLNQPIQFDYYSGDRAATQTVTQSFSDWGAPQKFSGESIVSTMADRITPSGTQQAGAWHVYGYTIPVDPSRPLGDIQFLVNRNVVILAANLDPAEYPAATPVTLIQDADVSRSATNSFADSEGLDSLGNDYAGELLGDYIVWNGIPFQILSPGGVSGIQQPLPNGYYSKLYLLATGYKGAQVNKPLVITYTDGSQQTVTQSFSDWGAPQHFAGETVLKTMPYRYHIDLTKQAGSWNIYGYTIALDKTKIVSSITMPAADVTAVAMTLLP